MIFFRLQTILILIYVSCFQAIGQIPDETSYNIAVEIENLQSHKGKVMVALYNSRETYMETRFREAMASISKELKASIVLTEVPAGFYAISVFHDENDNNELDLKFMKIPKEPYGFSNNARGNMGPASFEDALFKLDRDTTLHIEVR